MIRQWDATPDRYAAHASRGRWAPARHLVYASDLMVEALAEGDARLIFNFPPGHGKTDFFSWWLPIWYLDNFAGRNLGLGAYQSDIAIGYGRRVRNELASNPACRVKLAEDSKAAGRFHTDSNGGMFCFGVDTALLSRRLHLAVLDDPYKGWAEAYSTTVRGATDEWFHSTLMSRLEPNGSVIVVGQRFHPDDLHGTLAKDGWRVVPMPALAGAGDILGRTAGEPLWPERWDVAGLLRKRRDLKSDARWLAMYQQAPLGESAGRVYGHFSSRNIDDSVTLDPALPLHVLFDFNIRPGMHVEIGQFRELDGTFIVADEIHAESLDLRGALDGLETWLRVRGGFDFPEVHIFGDAAGHARQVTVTRSCYDMIGAKLSALRVPYRVRVPRKQPSVRDSIDAVNDVLLGTDGEVRLLVHPRCVRLVTDFRELCRSEDGLIDKTNLALSHGSDCVRYWVAFLRPAGRVVWAERSGGRVFVGA